MTRNNYDWHKTLEVKHKAQSRIIARQIEHKKETVKRYEIIGIIVSVFLTIIALF